MADALTDFIIKPSAPFAAGVVLFGVVWGFFKGVESVLTDDTKLEIAVWLLGVKVGQKLEPWPYTFSKLFERVFGARHLSFRCFALSAGATFLSIVLCGAFLNHYLGDLTLALTGPTTEDVIPFPFEGSITPLLSGIITATVTFLFLVVVDYASLFETRFVLTLMGRYTASVSVMMLLLLDVAVTGVTGVIPSYLTQLGPTLHPFTEYSHAIEDHRQRDLDDIERIHSFLRLRQRAGFEDHSYDSLLGRLERGYPLIASRHAERFLFLWLPTFFSSTWLWLYAASGFLLKAARHFDIGFDWFNRHFDIEHKPLSAIGLVAGALVALVYWVAVVVGRLS